MKYVEQKPISTLSLIFYISHYGSLIFDKYETNDHLYIVIDQKTALVYPLCPRQPVSITTEIINPAIPVTQTP